MAVSILATVIFMCIRESVNRPSTGGSKKGSEQMELLEHMDTDTSSDSNL